jgi:UDP-glucose:(heptosyl)LPS alpha-1,3-glucosyltransferase
MARYEFFLGSVWVKDIRDFYLVLDVLVHPSFYDTFGNVVAEILSMGVVSVLTTRRVGAKDLT